MHPPGNRVKTAFADSTPKYLVKGMGNLADGSVDIEIDQATDMDAVSTAGFSSSATIGFGAVGAAEAVLGLAQNVIRLKKVQTDMRKLAMDRRNLEEWRSLPPTGDDNGNRNLLTGRYGADDPQGAMSGVEKSLGRDWTMAVVDAVRYLMSICRHTTRIAAETKVAQAASLSTASNIINLVTAPIAIATNCRKGVSKCREAKTHRRKYAMLSQREARHDEDGIARDIRATLARKHREKARKLTIEASIKWCQVPGYLTAMGGSLAILAKAGVAAYRISVGGMVLIVAGTLFGVAYSLRQARDWKRGKGGKELLIALLQTGNADEERKPTGRSDSEARLEGSAQLRKRLESRLVQHSAKGALLIGYLMLKKQFREDAQEVWNHAETAHDVRCSTGMEDAQIEALLRLPDDATAEAVRALSKASGL